MPGRAETGPLSERPPCAAYREKKDARRGVRAKGATRRRDATVETTSEDGVGGWERKRGLRRCLEPKWHRRSKGSVITVMI